MKAVNPPKIWMAMTAEVRFMTKAAPVVRDVISIASADRTYDHTKRSLKTQARSR
tara:strand:- start:239 stop:403 length:165 start_codon:yes stop_codon:yes gene_type:complete